MRKERAMSNVSESFEFDDDIFKHIREEFRGMEDLNLKKIHTLRHEESHPEDEAKLPKSNPVYVSIGLQKRYLIV